MTDFLPDIDACVQVLQQGGIILYPTDTVWGLGCDATNEAAVAKIYRLKQRTPNSLIILLAEARQVIRYVAQPDPVIMNYLRTVEKPTTVIYDGAIGLANNVVGADGSVGIRVVSEPFCKHLIKRFRKPLVSTSANLTGKPTPAVFTAISNTVKEGVDYIVRYRQHDLAQAMPSAIVRWHADGTVTTLRP